MIFTSLQALFSRSLICFLFLIFGSREEPPPFSHFETLFPLFRRAEAPSSPLPPLLSAPRRPAFPAPEGKRWREESRGGLSLVPAVSPGAFLRHGKRGSRPALGSGSGQLRNWGWGGLRWRERSGLPALLLGLSFSAAPPNSRQGRHGGGGGPRGEVISRLNPNSPVLTCVRSAV